MAANGSSSAATNISVTVCPGHFGDAGKFVHTAAYCLLLVLALAGNILVILSVRKNQRLWTSSNYLIVNMAASDLLLPIIAVPRMIVEVLLGRETWLVHGTPGLISCKLVYFLQDVSTAVSVQSLVVITVERFVAVSFPLRAARMMQTKVKFLVPVTWAVAFGLHSVYLYTFQLCEVGGQGKLLCCQKWPSHRSQAIYFFIILILVFAVPLVLMIVMYSLIVVRLRRRKCPGDKSGSCRNRRRLQTEKQNRNVLKMAVAIVVVFFSCFCPLVVLALLRSSRAVPFQKCGEEIFRSVAKFLAQSNCAINPFIYFVFNEQFRHSFKRYLSIVFCCKKQGPAYYTSYHNRQSTYSLRRLRNSSTTCTAPNRQSVPKSGNTCCAMTPEPANV